MNAIDGSIFESTKSMNFRTTEASRAPRGDICITEQFACDLCSIDFRVIRITFLLASLIAGYRNSQAKKRNSIEQCFLGGYRITLMGIFRCVCGTVCNVIVHITQYHKYFKLFWCNRIQSTRLALCGWCCAYQPEIHGSIKYKCIYLVLVQCGIDCQWLR